MRGTTKAGGLVETRPAATVQDPAGLVTLAELVAEGLGEDIDRLAARLDGVVLLDDIGRRCCTRDTARALFAEHAERQAQVRRVRADADRRAAESSHSEWIRRGRRHGFGVPVPEGVGADVRASDLMIEADRGTRRDKRRSALDEQMGFTPDLVYHPLSEGQGD